MKLERKQDLSIYYWLTSFLGPLYSAIKVVDGFPTEPIVTPSVSIDGENIRLSPFQLGDRRGRRKRVWIIDVYAKNKAQRDEITSEIIDTLENGITVYDYDSGFPPVVVPQLGILMPYEIDATPVHMFEQMMEHLYWRESIRFLTEYSSVV